MRPGGILAVVLLLGLACGDGTTDPEPPPPVPVATRIEISQSAVTLAALGETARLSATVLDQIGREMDDVAMVWASGDTAVVDTVWLVTAVAMVWQRLRAPRRGAAMGSDMHTGTGVNNISGTHRITARRT